MDISEFTEMQNQTNIFVDLMSSMRRQLVDEGFTPETAEKIVLHALTVRNL